MKGCLDGTCSKCSACLVAGLEIFALGDEIKGNR